MGIKWETPEARYGGGRPRKWEHIATELKAKPGEWACVAENAATTTTGNIKRGYYAGMPAGEFEATSRGVKGSRAAKIYARYIGPVAS